MSVQDFKAALDRMTAMELAQIEGHLRILRWKNTPGIAEELTRVHAAMDAGKKVTQDQLEALMASPRQAKP